MCSTWGKLADARLGILLSCTEMGWIAHRVMLGHVVT